jgi:FAD-dependent oxidoreductase domain-containing protein 1
LTIDPTGAYFRREGLANQYICGLSPEANEEPSIDNLDVDQDFFYNKIWPILANRVKTFENLKV